MSASLHPLKSQDTQDAYDKNPYRSDVCIVLYVYILAYVVSLDQMR